MLVINAVREWVGSYLAILGSLISGKMMLDDQSDLPPHLRRENLD